MSDAERLSMRIDYKLSVLFYSPTYQKKVIQPLAR